MNFYCEPSESVLIEQIEPLELVHASSSHSMTNHLRYRGVAYDASLHEQSSDRPVQHVYRGHAYVAPLRRPAAPGDAAIDLCYRGHHYRSHRGQPQCA